ncbi:MAG: DUF1801 domain-containing protein [Nitrososphaerales archaeon]|jgi:hypothetical protein
MTGGRGEESGTHRPARRTEGARSRKKDASQETESPSQLIDARLKGLGDWREETLSRLRALIKQADPEVVEEVKWRKPSNPDGVPVWSNEGIICIGDAWKDHVRLTFAKGALLDDPSGLFNASLKGNRLRAVDLREGDSVNEAALKGLVRAAVALNLKNRKQSSRGSNRSATRGGHVPPPFVMTAD